MTVVLDASAMLAYLRGESGAHRVAEAITGGALMSAANWTEVLSKAAEEGQDPEEFTVWLQTQGILGRGVEVLPLTAIDATIIAKLRPLTRSAGLSLGVRACLALGMRLQLPVLTADRIWAGLGLDVDVRLIR
ncbi:MAG: VapC toxin family PIN domain ribonuclease [SAR202 cluster bacterium Io17-Chloro-G9]|nr:MAG: VapC toxin family PIN domain ribonuclease [SAR202 cluster bacterium Io17-Chloro-G9]